MNWEIRKQELLEKFLNDQCSLNELKELFDALVVTDSDDESYFEVMDAVWMKIQSQDPQLLSNESSERIFTEVVEANQISVDKKIYYKMASAAAIALLILGSLTYVFLFKNSRVTYATTFGNTKNITLPDGSQVTLNGNSTLIHKNTFKTEEIREVWLSGEAYFSVKHTLSNQKFIVHTSKDFNVEVLGTEFNVSKRKSGTKVTLNSGKIVVHISDPLSEGRVLKNITLAPGDLVEFSKKPSEYNRRHVNPEVYSSWKNKRLIFDNTPMLEIINILEETYGTKVELKDSTLLQKKILGTIPTQDMDVFLKVLSKSLNLEITKNQDHIVIQRR